MATTFDGRNRAIVIAESLAESYRCDSTWLAFVGAHIPPPPQKKHRIWSSQALRSLRCGSNRADWRSLVEYSFHVELWNGLRELAAFAEH